jgi:DNA-binding CsgD family transcriptional regulator
MMPNLIVYIVFVISAAFASAGVILSARLRIRYRSELFSSLLYYQVFIFTFGFYGIWGQVVVKPFLVDLVSADQVEKIKDIFILLGLPFLVFAMLMIIRFAREITGRKRSNWFIFWFLLVNFLVIFGIGFLSTKEVNIETSTLIKYYFIGCNFLYFLISSLLILFPGKRQKHVLQKHEARIISCALFTVMIIQCLILALYKGRPITGLVFIFFFFAGNSFLPLYFSYGITLPRLISEPQKDISFNDFCKRFEISPREADIITEICNGLSNKEIADKLFISLQTVKDHTHRIFIKTNVRSRVQLITLVNAHAGPDLKSPPN